MSLFLFAGRSLVPACAAVSLLLVAACHDADGLGQLSEGGDDERLTEVLPSTFQPRAGDAYAYAPQLTVDGAATRVALTGELNEVLAEAPAFEVRALLAGAPGSDWRPMEVTFYEEGLFNARVDFDAPFDGAELRLLADRVPSLRALSWAALTPLDDGDGSDELAFVTPGELESGLSSELSALGVRSRAEWGARAAVCQSAESNKWRMTVHHTVTFPDRPALRMRQMQNFHIDGRGWCDLAYHFVIALDGSIWEARPVDRRGGHVRYQNAGNIGISYLGCFSDYGCASAGGPHTQTDASIDAGRRLIATLAERYAIPRTFETLRGHTDWPDVRKSCPGNHTEAHWSTLRAGFTDEELGVTPPSLGAGYGLFDPGQGRWRVYPRDGGELVFDFGAPGDVPLVGDWNCDGVDTVGVYRPSTGVLHLRDTNTTGVADRSVVAGVTDDVPLAGDFNADGCDTVSFYRTTTGEARIYNSLPPNGASLGAEDVRYYFGNPGDKPFVGDFDGDGADTVGLHRESTGFLYFRQSHTQGNADAEFYFGDPGDRLIAGDWSGDGADTPAVFRPGNRNFYFRYTNTQGNADAQVTLGQGSFIPVGGAF